MIPDIIHAALYHDTQGPWFELTVRTDTGDEVWAAVPLDPIVTSPYEGRFQIIARM